MVGIASDRTRRSVIVVGGLLWRVARKCFVRVAPSGWIAIVALAVTAVGIVTNAVVIDRQRRASERTERQRQAGQVLGAVYALLVDINPERLRITPANETPEVRGQRWRARWEEKVREPLMTMHASYPSEAERGLALKLDIAIQNCITSTWQYDVHQAAGEHSKVWTYERAEGHWQEANTLAVRLASAIREGSPKGYRQA